jgi:hypothetical protein
MAWEVPSEPLEISPRDLLVNFKNSMEGFIRGMQKDPKADGSCLTTTAGIEGDFESAAKEATQCIFFNVTACVELANFGNILIETIQ